LGNQDWAVSAPDIVQEMSRSLIRGLTKPSNEGPERIYVSRKGLAQNRRLINENDLLRTIQGLGFQVVKPECLSLADQIRTFKDAKVVLGAFGAGLTNMLFSRAPSMILELQDPIFAPRYWYWKMASILGHEWCCCVGQSERMRNFSWAADWPSATFSVDEKELAAFLESALRTDLSTSKRQWWNCNPFTGVIS
jgi:capsular polysaccharide biosynthesis protein